MIFFWGGRRWGGRYGRYGYGRYGYRGWGPRYYDRYSDRPPRRGYYGEPRYDDDRYDDDYEDDRYYRRYDEPPPRRIQQDVAATARNGIRELANKIDELNARIDAQLKGSGKK